MGKQAKTAITPTRAEDFPEWYQQVIKAADMAENAPVRGCMTIKPYGYALWENMKSVFDGMIKDHGVDNAYFPLLIPLEFISREADHVEGFAKECAVVTHHRLEKGENGLVPSEDAKLEEPYVIRPTSETIIGDAMARWVRSYRDLPLKLNQWANVMRWEMRTRMFLRTSEFLWQEGHNAFETAEEAREDAFKMLEAYRVFAEDYLALPVFTGEKTEDERFPGAVATYTIEAMMQDGKALQAGTSHDLGQNFSKSIGIKFQGRDEGAEEFAHTTSWGISTRLIGGMIMIHGDDDGMIMPPRVAPKQVVILPMTKDDNADSVMGFAAKVRDELKAKGFRVLLDEREMRTPDKMWDAVKKGIPLRVEIGGREAEAEQVTTVRRDLGRESKTTLGVDEFISSVQGTLDAIHDELLSRSRRFRDENTHEGASVTDVKDFFAAEKIGFVKVPVALLEDESLDAVMREYSLSTRCMPFADDGQKVIISKAY